MIPMAEIFTLFTVLAIALMVLAVIGSIVPMIPGALLSITGILVYWWSTGYARPGTLFLASFIIVGLVAVLTDYFAGSIAAKVGGASTKTSIVAGMVGFLMFFTPLGPLGILVGVGGTVLIREYLRTGDAESSAKAAIYSTIGVLGSTAVQLVVTLSLLVAFIVALII